MSPGNENVARRLWPGRDAIGRRSANVPAGDETVWAGRRKPGGAFETPSRRAGNQRDGHAAADQSRTASDRIQAHSGAGGPHEVSKALLCAAGRKLFLSWTPPSFAGSLWCYLLFGYAADAGDRHTNGSWCD